MSCWLLRIWQQTFLKDPSIFNSRFSMLRATPIITLKNTLNWCIFNTNFFFQLQAHTKKLHQNIIKYYKIKYKVVKVIIIIKTYQIISNNSKNILVWWIILHQIWRSLKVYTKIVLVLKVHWNDFWRLYTILEVHWRWSNTKFFGYKLQVKQRSIISVN